MRTAPLDRIDRHLIAALARDGRRSYREIARALDVSEGTVRARLGRLLDEELVRVTVVGSPLALGVGVVVVILLRVKPGFVRQTAEALERIPTVRFVGLSFGSADIIVQSLHKDIQDLHRFVSEVIPKAAPAVTSTETFQIAEVLKSSWTWGDWFEYLEDGEPLYSESADGEAAPSDQEN